jgi:hypothetical protein
VLAVKIIRVQRLKLKYVRDQSRIISGGSKQTDSNGARLRSTAIYLTVYL